MGPGKEQECGESTGWVCKVCVLAAEDEQRVWECRALRQVSELSVECGQAPENAP